MADEQAKPRFRFRRVHAVIGGVLLLLFVAAAVYLSSDSFKDLVRRRVVTALEDATGGRVELKAFRWNLSRLEFEADDLTIHGLEPPGEIPYAHVDHLAVRLKIISLASRQVGLRYLRVDRPVFHLIVNPDGTTNQPVPKAVQKDPGGSPIKTLFDLAIERLEVVDGRAIYNDRSIPLDFTANKVVAEMSYSMFDRAYSGSINVDGIETVYQNFRPLQSRAELQFALREDAAEVKAFKWAAAKSQFEASGVLEDFRAPKARLKYNASLDLAELGHMARLPELRSGKLDVKGAGNYRGPKDFDSAGQIFMRAVQYQPPGVNLPPVSAQSNFSLDQARLSISRLAGAIFGGAISGEATVRHWMVLEPAPGERQPGRDPKSEVQQGTADLRLTGVSVAQLASAVSSRTLPLNKVNPVGSASGSVKLAWRGSPAKADAVLALNVRPPASPAPEQLPVVADLDAVYKVSAQAVDVRNLHLATRHATINARGAVGVRDAALTIDVRATSIDEFMPLIQAASPGTQVPVELDGPATFKGTIAGKLATPTIRGRLELGPFFSVVRIPEEQTMAEATAVSRSAGPTRTSRIRWDSLVADIEYAPTHASARGGLLRRGTAQANFEGRVALRQGKFTPDNPLEARARVRDADIAELQSLVGYNYPVRGILNAEFNVAGTQNQLRGSGHVRVSDGSAYGETFKSLTADVRMNGQETLFQNLMLSQNGARLSGDGSYHLTSKRFTFNARGSGIDIAKLRNLQTTRVRLTGVASFEAKGSGTVEAPVINADARLTDLSVNGEQVGDVVAQAVTRGEMLHLTARSSFQKAQINMDGDVRLRGDFPANVQLQIADLNLGPLARAYGDSRMRGETNIAGKFALSGPLKRPRELNVDGELATLLLQVEGVEIRNQGPVRFAMRDQVVSIESLHLVGDGTDLTASGTAALTGSQPLNLRADGRINLKVAETFNPDLISSGVTTLGVTVRGTVKRPALTGKIDIANAGFSLTDLPNGLNDVNGTLVFNQDRLQVQNLTGRTGGGIVNIGGFIAYRQGVYFDLTAKGDDIRVRYPPGVSANAHADLRFTGTLKNALLAGDVTITRFSLNTRFDFALYLARSNQPTPQQQADSILNNIRFDIRVITTPELRVETSLAKVSGDADLRIRGTPLRPVVLGRVNIAEGNVVLNGTEYHLERGDIIFANPTRIEPNVNIEASARVREYDITLSFHGTTSKLNTNYRSEPPLPEADIIALLALGRTREDAYLNQQNTNFTETASNAILGQALNAAVSSRVQKLFGVSRLKIDPQVGGPEGSGSNAGARVTIEQQVSQKVVLTYITNVSQSQNQVIQLEYNVNPNISLVAVRDQFGVVAFDVKIRQRKR